jgi:hypothetical protein
MSRRIRANGISLLPRIHPPLQVGSSFEALVVRVAEVEARGGAGHLWKIVRSFDDPATWSEPGVRQLVATTRAEATFREHALPDEWELYDLDADPIEARNCSREPAGAGVFEYLRRRLEGERARVVPSRNRPWPYANDQASVRDQASAKSAFSSGR